MRRPNQSVAATLATASLIACTGCHSSDHAPRTSPPTSTADCNSMNATHGDPGIVLGWDWSTGDHPLNSPATIDVCLAPHLGDVVVVTADARVAKISPRRFTLPESSNGVVPFRVTAIATGTAHLTLRLHDAEGKTRATMPGPTIVAAHPDWHLYCATADKSYCG